MLPQTRTRGSNGGLRRRAAFGSDIDGLFDAVMRSSLNSWAAWAPAADLYETEDAFVLEIGLAGFAHEDIDVTVERGVLTVAGQRSTREEQEEHTYHLREHSYERFARSFSLPGTVRSEDVEADFENGMLVVRLPKTPEAKPRRIAVRAAAS
ncbi:MAG: Hsp20/alpha crystallin family protein [Gemmatimonadota bacterium]|nr:Hsp20/alpha crystallin family protein [Gemmatimonadota bacterium]